MKHTLQQIFRSPNFVIGFAIFMALILFVFIYPLVVPDALWPLSLRAPFSHQEPMSVFMTALVPPNIRSTCKMRPLRVLVVR